jgi:hypothetical protein
MKKTLLGFLILVTLVAPVLAADMVQDFYNGQRVTFSTRGHPKAKGVNINIEYPVTWKAEEGKRPNVVQVITSENGRGQEMAIILVKDIGLPKGIVFTKRELNTLLQEAMMSFLPEGATSLSAKITTVDSIPAAMLQYILRAEATGTPMLGALLVYTTVVNGMLVNVQFMVGAPEEVMSQRAVLKHMARFLPLFHLMANSIIFPDQWK